MKTKTPLTAIFLLAVLLPGSLLAQKFQIGLTTGYAFGVNEQTHHSVSEWIYSHGTNDVIETRTGINDSYGKGVPVDLTVGWIGKHGISYGIMMGYLKGGISAHQAKLIYHDGEADEFNYEHQGQYFYGAPYFGFHKSISKFAISISVAPTFNKVYLEDRVTVNYRQDPNDPKEEQLVQRTEYQGGLTVGFRTNLAAEYVIKELIGISLSLGYSHLNYSPNSKEMVFREFNGEDILDDLPIRDRKVTYDNNHTIQFEVDQSNGQVSQQQPEDRPYETHRISLPFDNVSLQLGIKVYLSRKNKGS